MIADHYRQRDWYPLIPPAQTTTGPYEFTFTGVSQKEFDQLKKDVLEMKELLRKAKEYDTKNNEPDCEVEDKVKFLTDLAKVFDVDLEDVLKSKKNANS